MSFGTAVHEAIQAFLIEHFGKGEEAARQMDTIKIFTDAFKREVTRKNIKHTPEEFAEFVEDGKNILSEFLNPANVILNFAEINSNWLVSKSNLSHLWSTT